MDTSRITTIIVCLRELEADTQLPKNFKMRIGNTIRTLEESSELSVSRALSELEELADDTGIQAFTRTQIFNIVSMLEAANS